MPRPPDGIYDDGTVALWIEAPNLFFTQLRTSHYTVDHVKTFVGPIMDQVRGALPRGPYVWVSDSRELVTYESGSRVLLTRWGIQRKTELARVIILASAQHKLILMGTHVAATAAALAGISMKVVTSIEALGGEGIAWPGLDPPRR